MTNQTIQLAISITGSQKRLADLCGVAQPTVWRWLHGGGIDARYVMKIVSATGGKIKPADTAGSADHQRCVQTVTGNFPCEPG
ncbi:YdaS family helix-turn-helix protein [Escherichia coli]|uniref:YdaS family helix-turn-helix protein n=3 Tax=Escherichia coli TaxID=562 RepID=UPI00201D18B9|nr:YdaS family helix-turn-helix protein [Escherichia coli]